MNFDPEEYRLDFFLDNGFHRKSCSVCKEYFWTLDDSLEVCQESPCVNYDFLLRRYTPQPLSLAEVRREFIQFFADRGHKPVKPYPLVARWRSDIYLTDASIVAFQPWVTDGIAPPPANPLVISQPCARLVDLDKVGLTFGRHLTVFEMGGHHAFNYPDRYIYWKSETTAYCHEFMTQVLQIRPEEITYKEAWWAGGGNEGPCLEVIAGGLELATLVFMKFKTVDGGRLETSVKTVDTGYGIERLAWFTTGTPSAFETIYRGVMWDVAKILGVERPSDDILRRYSLYTGQVIPKGEVTTAELRRRVASLSGLSMDEIRNFIEPYEKMCSTLDFTKAIAFILAEGIVPSNVRAGYLARLLIRRAYRLLRYFRCEDKLLDLLDLQLSYWSADFPHLGEMKDEVLELVGYEVGKFRETLARGSEHVIREIKELRKREAVIPPEMLVRIYDERGITPDIVAEFALSEGLDVQIPENFYELVAARHLREAPQPTKRTEMHVSTENYPKTRKLYYETPWSFSFQARVLGVENGFIILDSTLFYPEGGGQVGDTGELLYDGKRCRIKDTQQLGDIILHGYDGEPPNVGDLVEGLVDRERRLSIVRHHTATHILIGAVRRLLGKHAWQAGAKKEAEMGRLDIYHHKRLTDEDVRAIEEAANSVVARRIPVKIEWRERNEAEMQYGFSLYQGGEVPLGMIRVVEIPGWDAEACGGLHCENTEDVGLIKIVRTERIQDGVERLIFTAGPASLKDIQRIEGLLVEVASKVASPLEEAPRKVAELSEEVKNLRKKLRKLWDEMMPLKVAEVRQVGISLDGLTVYTHEEEEEEQDYIITLAAEIVKTGRPALCIIFVGAPSSRVVVYANEQAIKHGYDAGVIASRFCANAGGKGGGRGALGQGYAPKERARETLADLPKLLLELKNAGKM